MSNLAIAPSFRKQFADLKNRLPHGLILTGSVGIGLNALAKELAGRQAVVIQPSQATKTSRGSIGIETIRQLYELTRTHAAGRRVIVIEAAELMSHSAQNAFLKLLEEPGEGTHFILTSHASQVLLPTIRSRAQIVRIPHITPSQSQKLLQAYNLTAEETAQALFVASGLPAKLTWLARNPAARQQLIDVMRDARAILSGESYQAYATALRYGDSLTRALQLLDAVRLLCEHSLKQSADPRLLEKLEYILQTHQRLRQNANPRLQLARFVVQYQ